MLNITKNQMELAKQTDNQMHETIFPLTLNKFYLLNKCDLLPSKQIIHDLSVMMKIKF